MGTYDGLPKALQLRGQLLPMLAGLLVLSAMFGATFHKVIIYRSAPLARSSSALPSAQPFTSPHSSAQPFTPTALRRPAHPSRTHRPLIPP